MKQQMLEADVKELRASIEALTAERDALKVQNEYQEQMIRQADERGDYWRASAEKADADADAAETDNARLREALETCLTTMERADFADGWCCCGDNMLNHPSPMNCGHSPVDMGEYHASLAIKNARAALNAGKADT
jgi:hypothetical protein